MVVTSYSLIKDYNPIRGLNLLKDYYKLLMTRGDEDTIAKIDVLVEIMEDFFYFEGSTLVGWNSYDKGLKTYETDMWERDKDGGSLGYCKKAVISELEKDCGKKTYELRVLVDNKDPNGYKTDHHRVIFFDTHFLENSFVIWGHGFQKKKRPSDCSPEEEEKYKKHGCFFDYTNLSKSRCLKIKEKLEIDTRPTGSFNNS